MTASAAAPAVPEGEAANPIDRLTPEQLDAIARELDAIREQVRADLGERDAAYIRRVVDVQRVLEASARILLIVTRSRGSAAAATALLTVAKILENMEIGHNVMHGQWDWMRDPRIHSSTWEWDAVSTAQSWKHAHNYQHHTYTNVVGKDRDLGYSAIRVHPDQPWHPVYLLQPVYAVALAFIFEWAIAIYDMELDAVGRGTKSAAEARGEVRAFARKAGRQFAKDYVLFPALSGRAARRTLLANLTANTARSIWTHTIVFMGHLPEGAETFTERQLEDESRGAWYVRQLLGSCNLDGSRLFHLMSGHLSFQVEHHLFPDLPSNRYPQIAGRVRAVCERHGLPYESGRLGRQYRSVAKKVLRFALP
ncbi:MAG TPA: acyl-CoA desaturase [Conexibacter sp.]|nr:acyl-CoA desaturase [Conexibacter sp.]